MPDPRLFIAACLFASPALSQTFEVNSVHYSTENNFFEALSGELQVYKTESTLLRVEDDVLPEWASGRCFGSFTILRGFTSGGGNCVYATADGDRMLQSWTIDDVALGKGYGTWHIIGGTGALTGIKGRGTWASETIARTGESVRTNIGTATLPEN